MSPSIALVRTAARRRGSMRCGRRTGAALLLVALGASPLAAHETRPGLLEIIETGPESASLLWKRPSGGEVEIRIGPVVPEGCRFVTPDRQQLTPGAEIVRQVPRIDEPLGVQPFRFDFLNHAAPPRIQFEFRGYLKITG